MKEYNIEVTMWLAKVVTIEAESVEDAIEKVEVDYYNADLVLDPVDFIDVAFEVLP